MHAPKSTKMIDNFDIASFQRLHGRLFADGENTCFRNIVYDIVQYFNYSMLSVLTAWHRFRILDKQMNRNYLFYKLVISR